MVFQGSFGVWAVTGFFAVGGILGLVGAIFAPPHPPGFWALWDALGASLVSFLVAAGLWRRFALFRSLAAVYCVVMPLTYLAVLILAYAEETGPVPRVVILNSLYEIPSCILLLPYLRSSEAAAAFSRSVFHP
jgi:hypothetical protein